VRRLAFAVALVLAVVLVAAAGVSVGHRLSGPASGSGPTPVVPSGGPPATQPPSPALAPYYSQKLTWSDCNGGDRCARLTVPLDYRRPAGPTLRLAVLSVPASGSKIGSLVVNPGGPGVPGTSRAAEGAAGFGDPLLQHFDIVGFDPRGTGASSPVDCLSDSQLNHYLAVDPQPSTPAELRAFRAAQQSLARGCSRLSGALASHISTVESARDMDILRAALGDSRLNYLGSSYGTELGATYAQLFPDRVGRFVLDGAVDPTLTMRQSSLQQAAGFQQAFEAYAESCVSSDIGCFLGKSVPAVEQTVTALLDRIAAHPLPAGNGRELTVGDAVYGITYPLYSRAAWILLSSALRAALQGDGSQLMRLADLYAARNADGTFQNNTMEAFFAISCLDDPHGLPYRKVPSQFPTFEKASPLFGKVFAWGLTSCDGFTPRSDQRRPTIHARGAAPIVVIGTSRDPATPYHWAVDLAHQLDSGILVTRIGDGHTAYHTGNACIDHAVESYLVSGVVPKAGLTC
jgi:pimeloyl-ACP methyl ester carboxylesterase